MNHLQRLLKLKKITARDVSKGTGLGYHTIFKTIRGDRTAKHVREAIASYLNLPYSHVWGVSSAKHLVRQIDLEIESCLVDERLRMRTRFLNSKNSLPNPPAVSNG